MATPYTPVASDASRPLDSDDASVGAAELRALKARVNQAIGAAQLPAAVTLNQAGLTNLLYPSIDGNFRDIYRGGWLPAFFNQRWGGSQIGMELDDGATGNNYKFDFATGSIDAKAANNGAVASAASATYVGQGFKVAENLNVQAIWLRLGKIGNTTNSLNLRILPDDGTGTKPTGNTPITNGTATAIPARQLSIAGDGEFVRFVFPTPPALVAGTQYHIVISSSGAVDASNYFVFKYTDTRTYPHGNYFVGDATPTWSATIGQSMTFFVESTSDTQFFQRNGQFSGCLKFLEGAQLNQSKALVQPLRNFFSSTVFTALHRIGSPVKGKPIADYLYGFDHDRISLACAISSGFPVLTLYDTNGVQTQLVGTTDISVGGIFDIAIVARTVGDTGDYLQLWVNGVMQASIAGTAFVLDPLFRDQGTAWLGGGFPVAPVWTQKLDMTVLPSTQGWTWTGTAVEVNAMSIQGGKLRQNLAGYASGDSGYYVKTAAGFSNVLGGAFVMKAHSPVNTATINNSAVSMQLADGTRTGQLTLNTYYAQFSDAAGSYSAGVQQNVQRLKDMVLAIVQKGNDSFLFANGRLLYDFGGSNTAATVSNQLAFGDFTTTANANADASYDYVAYYNVAAYLPAIATGMFLHEYAYWHGNYSSLLPTLWNTGLPYSVKAITGAADNYTKRILQEDVRSGTNNGNFAGTTVAAGTLVGDCIGYMIGDTFDTSLDIVVSNNGAGNYSYASVLMDGAFASYNERRGMSVNANQELALTTNTRQPPQRTHQGLHRFDVNMYVNAGTGSFTMSRTFKFRNSPP